MNAHLVGKFPAYDGKAFFATDHPNNPYRLESGTYANLFTGAPNSAFAGYPGALPIDESVDVDDALQNLQKLFAYVASIKMPNGEQPRRLRIRTLLVPPSLIFRAVQLTQAKFIAQVAGSGAAPADIEGIIRTMGFANPIQADELAGFEDGKTYFAIAEQIAGDELGGAVYLDREAYHINYYGPQDESRLNRMNKLEWHCEGRNGIGSGHPFLIFKVRGV
jgi:hypothetical protein